MDYDLLACLADAAAASPLGGSVSRVGILQRQLPDRSATCQVDQTSDRHHILLPRRHQSTARTSPSPPAEADVAGPACLQVEREVQVTCNGTFGTFLLPSQTVQCHCARCVANVAATAAAAGSDPASVAQHAPAITPTEFERHSGLLTAKKWRNSIRLVQGDGTITIGKWLEQHNILPRPKCSGGPLGSPGMGASGNVLALYSGLANCLDGVGHHGGPSSGNDSHNGAGARGGGSGAAAAGNDAQQHLLPSLRSTLPPSRYPASEYVTGEDDEYDEVGAQPEGHDDDVGDPDGGADDGAGADDEDYEEGGCMDGGEGHGSGAHGGRGGRRHRGGRPGCRGMDRRGVGRGGSRAAGQGHGLGRPLLTGRPRSRHPAPRGGVAAGHGPRAAGASMPGSGTALALQGPGPGSGGSGAVDPRRGTGASSGEDGGGGGDGKDHSSSEGSQPSDDSKRRDGSGGSGEGDGSGTGDGGDSRRAGKKQDGEHRDDEAADPTAARRALRHSGGGAKGPQQRQPAQAGHEGQADGTAQDRGNRHVTVGKRTPADYITGADIGPALKRIRVRPGSGGGAPGGSEELAPLYDMTAAGPQVCGWRFLGATGSAADQVLISVTINGRTYTGLLAPQPTLMAAPCRPPLPAPASSNGTCSGRKSTAVGRGPSSFGKAPPGRSGAGTTQMAGAHEDVEGHLGHGDTAEPLAPAPCLPICDEPFDDGMPTDCPRCALCHRCATPVLALPPPSTPKAASIPLALTPTLTPATAPAAEMGMAPVVAEAAPTALDVPNVATSKPVGPDLVAALHDAGAPLLSQPLSQPLSPSVKAEEAEGFKGAPPAGQPGAATPAADTLDLIARKEQKPSAAAAPASPARDGPTDARSEGASSSGSRAMAAAEVPSVPVAASEADGASGKAADVDMQVDKDCVPQAAAPERLSLRAPEKAMTTTTAAATTAIVVTMPADATVSVKAADKATPLLVEVKDDPEGPPVPRESSSVFLAPQTVGSMPSIPEPAPPSPRVAAASPAPEASRTVRQAGYGLGPLVDVKCCSTDGSGAAGVASVHAQCALWSPDVFIIGGTMYGVPAVIKRGRVRRCTHCNRSGATLSCCNAKCGKTYHLPCAMEAGLLLVAEPYSVACPEHRHTATIHPVPSQPLGRLPASRKHPTQSQDASMSTTATATTVGTASVTACVAAGTGAGVAHHLHGHGHGNGCPQQVALPASLAAAAGRRIVLPPPVLSTHAAAAAGALPAGAAAEHVVGDTPGGAASRQAARLGDAGGLPALMMLRSHADGSAAVGARSLAPTPPLSPSTFMPPPTKVAGAGAPAPAVGEPEAAAAAAAMNTDPARPATGEREVDMVGGESITLRTGAGGCVQDGTAGAALDREDHHDAQDGALGDAGGEADGAAAAKRQRLAGNGAGILLGGAEADGGEGAAGAVSSPRAARAGTPTLLPFAQPGWLQGQNYLLDRRPTAAAAAGGIATAAMHAAVTLSGLYGGIGPAPAAGMSSGQLEMSAASDGTAAGNSQGQGGQVGGSHKRRREDWDLVEGGSHAAAAAATAGGGVDGITAAGAAAAAAAAATVSSSGAGAGAGAGGVQLGSPSARQAGTPPPPPPPQGVHPGSPSLQLGPMMGMQAMAMAGMAGVPPMFMTRAGGPEFDALDPSSGLRLSHAAALALLQQQQQQQQSGSCLPESVALFLGHSPKHAGGGGAGSAGGGEGSVGSPFVSHPMRGMPGGGGRPRHHHHYSQQGPGQAQAQGQHHFAGPGGATASTASASTGTGVGRAGGAGGMMGARSSGGGDESPPHPLLCAQAGMMHVLPRAARNIESLLPSRPLLHNPYVPSSGDPSADLTLSKIAQKGSREVEAELLGGTTGRAGHSGRCAVCVIQRKGKCGTESAPKKCLRRQLVALQRATGTGGSGEVEEEVPYTECDPGVGVFPDDRAALAAAEQRARERARRETWSLPLGQGSGATGKRPLQHFAAS